MPTKTAKTKKTIRVTPKLEKKEPKKETVLTFNDLDLSGEIAFYYGFAPTETPEIKRVDIENARSLIEGDVIEDEGDEKHSLLPLHVEEKVAILRTYQEKNMAILPQPVMLYFKGPFKNTVSKKTSPGQRYCDLEIVGSTKSISEAILIQTALIILAQEGYTDVCVEINSMGDKDSLARFSRELNNYCRKNIEDIPAHCRQAIKKDVFELLNCTNEKCHEFKEAAPKSISYLSEASREHFKEVLEYLEALNIPYRINNNLFGNKKYCSETIFEIISTDETKPKHERTLALGVRYDGLSKRIGFKREVGGVGISLLIKREKTDKKRVVKIKKPTIYFIQLGFEAKCHSLQVIEMLRLAKIPLYQSLGKDKMVAQVGVAEKLKISHTLLMGKKEAMEQSIIVRDMVSRCQETVPLADLINHLKKTKV